MATYEFAFKGMHFGAPSLKELHAMIAEAGKLVDAMPGVAIEVSAPSYSERTPSVLSGKDGPNCAAFKLAMAKGFRMTNEELAKYGEGNREAAAYARLHAIGLGDKAVAIAGVTDATNGSKGPALEIDPEDLGMED